MSTPNIDLLESLNLNCGLVNEWVGGGQALAHLPELFFVLRMGVILLSTPSFATCWTFTYPALQFSCHSQCSASCS